MNAVGVKKDSNEVIDRQQINQIKQTLKEKFRDRSFSAPDLSKIASGQSELTLLIENLQIKEVHINLIYALIEHYQADRVEVIDRNPWRCRIKS
ncbi:hypothetical protein LEP3755_53390 [Leptolyngbya sp. NIES-3755]|nr:hypothetical protein LEP3755_53390 [Leptolyngbya sp. NIES-3755]